MRILLLTLGSRGDVQPCIALGAALRARGHDVVLTTWRGFETMIAAHGLAAMSLSDDVRGLIERPDFQQALRSLSGKIRAWRASKGLFGRQLDEMWAIAREVRPGLIVYHPKAVAAPHIAEALGVVAVPMALVPAYVPTGDFPSAVLPVPDLGRFANRMSHKAIGSLTSWLLSSKIDDWRRKRLGLMHARLRDFFGGYSPTGEAVLRLHAFSRHLVPVPEDWGEREHVTGYWFLDQVSDWKPPEGLARFLDAGPPPVYVGFGSMPTDDAERLTRIVLDALQAAGQRGVLATGWGGLESTAGSERIHVLDAAPHDWLFPRCSAVVHHGGAGTTHEGLRWGRPSIICPVFGDQPFWGRRVMKIGAGPAPVPQKRLSVTTLAGALAAVQSPAVVSRAAEIGTAIRAETGAKRAAALLDSLIAASDRASR